ncbi:MAG: Xylulokinase [Bacteroidota bacterium]|jgi:xylulokinase
MLLCGVDVGTSSIKVSVVDASNQQLIYSTSYPEIENEISSPAPGFAEQDPEHWWYCVQQAILMANASQTYKSTDIAAIGISYQMHGLVVLDDQHEVVRPSIIWCDSRAVEIGNHAFDAIGHAYCQANLLNSPGNFTASKLAWVKENQPELYERIAKVMLPGDFIAGRLTNHFTTTASALSEGIFYDFNADKISKPLIDYFGFDASLFPHVQDVFSNHGVINSNVADTLGLNNQVQVTYKAGDQPNNAFSLGVLQPGDIATTAGTSGVVYGISDELKYDTFKRVNSFAHVNYRSESKRIGVLMCINGTGILNRWIKQTVCPELSYPEMNTLAASTTIGSKGLLCVPFGNGAERIFQNQQIGASFEHLDFNRHGRAEMIRSAQEGIAFSMAYGIEMLADAGIKPTKLKAGFANMYLSEIFAQTIVNASNVSVDLLESDGAFGAALGAGVGINYFKNEEDAVRNIKHIKTINPNNSELAETKEAYEAWKELVNRKL